MKQKIVYLAITAALFITRESFSQAPVNTAKPIYAQKLADEVIKKNPDMLDILFHVSPSEKEKNTVIAAHLTKDIGEISGDDDLGVMNTGKPLVEVQKDGVRIGVLVQMKDSKGNAIGALGLMYPYHTGEDQGKFLTRSNAIRDYLANQIINVRQLNHRN